MVFSFVIIICNALNSFHVLKNCHCLLQQRNWFCLQVLSVIDYSGSNCFLDVFWSLTLIFISKIFPCCVREQYFTKTVFLALSVAEQNKCIATFVTREVIINLLNRIFTMKLYNN